jgi:DNA polymerase I-like protein with 3'-5' exonuclease and polymerase domains/intein/homing endonuclease
MTAIMAADTYAFDTETTGVEVRSDVIIGMSFTIKVKKDSYRSWYFKPSPEMPVRELLKKFEPAFLDGQKLCIMHNAKFDLQMLQMAGTRVYNKLCCTKVMAWIIDENRIGRLNLKGKDSITYDLFGVMLETYKESSLSGSLFGKDEELYGCDDTLYTHKLYERLLPDLEKQGLTKLFWEVEMQILPIVIDMELRGMYLDVPTLYALEKTLLEKHDAIAQDFYTKAGRRINIGSTEQLSAFFFDELKWEPKPGMERGKNGLYPTGEAILSKYAENDHLELAQLVLDYRGVLKLLQTYVRPLTKLAVSDPKSRIHSTINQTGTVTGRFCVSADTSVTCSHGVFPITEVKVGDAVLTHEGRFRRVLNVIYKGEERMWRVRTSRNHNIRCTMNHRFLTPEGWKSLREIHFNDKVKVLEGSELVYDTLSWFMPSDVEAVWDLEVEEDHSYVGNGFVNHNSSSAPNLQNCFDDKTEILTDSGWKLFKDLDRTESVKAFNKEDESFRWEKPTAYVCRAFSGDLVSIQGAAVDLVMTKEHNCLIQNNCGEWEETAADAFPLSLNHSHMVPYIDLEYAVLELHPIRTAALYKHNVSYSGNVYCVTVPSGYIVVRRNGKISLTGNCPREKGTIKCAFKSPSGKTLIVADECVAEGTKIATSTGVQTIESITQGTQVVQEDGSYRTVLRVAQSGIKPCLLMTTKCGYSLAATKDHKIRVINQHGDYVWKLLGQVSSGDFVAISSNWLRGGSSPLPDIQFTHHNNKGISTPGLTTTEFARFCGFITGNGTMPERCGYVGWVVCDKDKDVDAELANFFTQVFSRSFSTSAYRGVIEHKVSSTPLVCWLKELGVAKDRIPGFVWTGGPAIAGAWLSGLFDSDGCCTLGLDGRVSFCSSRQSLVYDVQDLLLGLGIPSSARKQKQTEFCTDGKPHYKDGKVHFAWHLSVNSTGLQAFKDKVGFKAARKAARLDELLQSKTKVNPKSGGLPNQQERVKSLTKEGILTGEPRRLLNNTFVRNTPITPVVLSKVKGLTEGNLFRYDLIENGVIFLPVVSVEDIGMKNTFDLEIEDSHTFLSNGFITHNSQLELRIMAHLSQDPTMLNIYRTGGDLHQTTQDAIGCKERNVAKGVNFGLIYQMGPQTFQANLWRTSRIALSIKECQKFSDAFFSKYPAVREYHEKISDFLRRHKYVKSLTGRRRHLVDEMKANYGSALRQAINFTVQGLGADIVKIAMRNFQRELLKKRVENSLWEEVFMVMQVHDEIVIEAPLEIAQEASALLKHCMETAVTLSIPLIAEPKIAGPDGSWEDCK